MQPIRCAIYTRKSSDEGLDKEFNTLEAQRESALSYIQSQKHQGWVALPTMYDDGGFSGGNMNRPAFQSLLADIKDGKIDMIVVYKIDRLTRSLLDFSELIKVLDENQCSFVSVTQHFNTCDSMGKLTLNILLSFAQFERELSSERIRDKIAATKKKGQFWLTGSQQFHLMKNVSESLAGRVAILDLQGFSQSEKEQDETRPAFVPDIPLATKRQIWTALQTFDVIVKGSFPQLFDGTPPNLFYSGYIRTYLERDVREILNISNENAFIKFLKVAAARTGQMLNYNDMARDVDVSVNTIKSWISVLETSGLIYLLPAYSNNMTKRAVKTPKLYFLD